MSLCAEQGCVVAGEVRHVDPYAIDKLSDRKVVGVERQEGVGFMFDGARQVDGVTRTSDCAGEVKVTRA